MSGCGSLSLACQYLSERKGPQTTAFLVPTWENHYPLFERSGKIITLNMYDPKTNGFRSDEVMDALKNKVPLGCTVLFQACAQNPTGIDPSEQDWSEMSKICKERKLLPLVDSAYLGYISGNVTKDAIAIRVLLEDKHEFFVCHSFSKIMGLYGERIGVLHAVCKNKELAKQTADYFRYQYISVIKIVQSLKKLRADLALILLA